MDTDRKAELNDPFLRKLICKSAETAQVGKQHCRLDVVDVAALDGARHNLRARISTDIGGKKFTINPSPRRHFENWGEGRQCTKARPGLRVPHST